MRWTSEPQIVLDVVGQFAPRGMAAFAASRRLLLSSHSPEEIRLTWFDRDGAELGTLGEKGEIAGPRLSPSGDHVAVGVASPRTMEDIWVHDLDRGTASRLTFTDEIEEGRPIWSPDGERIDFYSNAAGPPDIRVRQADGSGEESTIAEGPAAMITDDWSPDGSLILFSRWPEENLWLASVATGETRPYLEAPGQQDSGRFSPDGEWVAFESTETGAEEVFVAPAEDGKARRRISVDGGGEPVWSRRGDELFYRKERSLYAVPVERSDGLSFGSPRELFRIDPPLRLDEFDADPDRDRFLAAVSQPLTEELTVLVDWATSLVE